MYIDSHPYYFNWVTVKEPYSFRVSPGYHTFRFILQDKEIILQGMVDCRHGQKTIFSLDEDLTAAYVKTVIRENKFSNAEIQNLSMYVFTYRGISIPGANSYLEQYQRIIPLQQQRMNSLPPARLEAVQPGSGCRVRCCILLILNPDLNMNSCPA
jgi:hypothetical protein